MTDVVMPFKVTRQGVEPDGKISVQFETTKTVSLGDGRNQISTYNSFLILEPDQNIDDAIYDYLVEQGWINA